MQAAGLYSVHPGQRHAQGAIPKVTSWLSHAGVMLGAVWGVRPIAETAQGSLLMPLMLALWTS